MDIQNRYWKFLVQIKAWVFYLDIYADDSYKWERRVNMWLAITASSSIAAWTIWRQFSFLWALLIAISQVTAAIKQYLPFSKRLEIIRPFVNDLQLLFNKMDYSWYRISCGTLNADEISEILYDYKNQYTQLEIRYLKTNNLLENERFLKLADQKTSEFFRANY